MSSPPKSVADHVAEMRARDQDVDDAITLAATTAEKNQRSRGDFLQRAAQLWDELFETEEAREQKRQARIASWDRFMAEMHSPENVAAREAAAKALRDREAAAKAARSYPVLYPAKRLGHVLAVYDDGLVRMGTIERGEGGEEAFAPLPSETGRVIRFEGGGGACPEQHDAFIGQQQVGYLRLRHGMFRADYPDCGGETVLEGCPLGDGEFKPEERPEWLDRARAALYEAWRADWVNASDEDIEAEVARQHKAKADEEAEHARRWQEYVAQQNDPDETP